MSELVGAIIVSAGLSTRMQGIDKSGFQIDGVPLLVHTARVFQFTTAIDEISLVVREDQILSIQQLIEEYSLTKVKAVCIGGKTRRDSVKIGLESLSSVSWIVVHDGARPLVTKDLIIQGLDMAKKTGASTAGIPLKDTLKTVSSKSMVVETLDRNSIVLVQTPQTFRREILEKAHQEFSGEAVDDAVMVEKLGIPVFVYPGLNSNIKITTPEDLKFLKVLMKG